MIYNIADIKQSLKKLDSECNWIKTTNYLYTHWKLMKHDSEMTILLIQQMMIYVLDIDNGCVPELHYNNNSKKTNRVLFLKHLTEAVEYGLNNTKRGKYFLWQMCYFLKYIPTYYPLLSYVIPSVDAAEQYYHSLIKEAMQEYPDSILFSLLDRYKNNEYIAPCNSEQIMKTILVEVDDFHLQNNMADLLAKEYIENMYGFEI